MAYQIDLPNIVNRDTASWDFETFSGGERRPMVNAIVRYQAVEGPVDIDPLRRYVDVMEYARGTYDPARSSAENWRISPLAAALRRDGVDVAHVEPSEAVRAWAAVVMGRQLRAGAEPART